MPLECPRCLLINPDSTLTCKCGYDLTPQIRKLPGATTVTSRRVERRVADTRLTKEGFAVGIVAVWILLIIGEWIRLRPELGMRNSLHLFRDSVLLSLTDLAGAMIIGALGWIVVWIILSYEGSLRPCPKRTTLVVTIVSAALLFVSRWIAPDILAQHVVQLAIILGIAAVAYYAGCRGWLGKW